jgi:glycerophosphoryl diester phosphodiesterase
MSAEPSSKLQPGGPALFLGHRGTRIYAPENTFEAFDIALEHGCDGFEFDVRRTADGLAAVCHDAHFHHLKVDQYILDQLRALHPLPTLGEVLERYGNRAYINIELKDAGLEAETIRLLDEFPAERVLVTSFLPEVITELASLRGNRDIPLGFICRNLKLLDAWRTLPISHAIINHAIFSKTLHRELRDAGKQLFVWTINDAAEVERFRELGVDGIISDDTKLSRSVSAAKAQAAPIVS